jgi:hypothetical protein
MKVTIPYEPVWEAMHWAKENCPSYFTNDIHKSGNSYDNTRIDFFFIDREDALMFALRWGGQ